MFSVTNKETLNQLVISSKHINCPKHGKHPHAIRSSIPGHEGTWCQICWLDSLGKPLDEKTEGEKA